MKNTQKGFVAPLLIAIIAVLAVGGGMYLYSKKTNQPSMLIKASISNVAVSGGGIMGNLTINWESAGVEKVNIYLFHASDNRLVRTIAASTDNKETFYYEIEDIAAWRDYDGPFKVVVSSATDASVKSESSSVTIGRPCSPDVCGDPKTTQNTSNDQTVGWKTHINNAYGFQIKYPPVGDVLEKGDYAGDIGNYRFIVGLQANSAPVQRSLYVDVRKANDKTECSGGGVGNEEYIRINGIGFIKNDASGIYSTNNVDTYANEYCAVHNNLVYVLTTKLSFSETINRPQRSDLENDTIINQAINSFKFTR